jgi:5-methylthioribose kinase
MRKILYFTICISLVSVFVGAENKQITFDELKDITENKKTIMTDNIYDYSCKFYEQKQFDEFIQKMKKDNNLFIYSNKNVKITASSHLSTGNSNYMESNMMDGDLKTIWVEGAKDFGFKEWVKISSNFNKIFFPHYLITTSIEKCN